MQIFEADLTVWHGGAKWVRLSPPETVQTLGLCRLHLFPCDEYSGRSQKTLGGGNDSTAPTLSVLYKVNKQIPNK